MLSSRCLQLRQHHRHNLQTSRIHNYPSLLHPAQIRAPLVTLRADETSAAVILSFIAAETGAKIIIKQDGLIDFLEIKRATVPDAIAQVAHAAHLWLKKPDSYLKTTERIYEIDNPVVRLSAKSSDWWTEFEFKGAPVARAVEALAENLNIKARVETQNPGQILNATILNTNPIEALQTVADAADLEISKEANGYILRDRSVDLKFTDVLTSQLFKTIEKQFGIPVRLAPNLPDKLVTVDLHNLTPIEALKATAKAADLDLSEENGVYMVRERAVTTK